MEQKLDVRNDDVSPKNCKATKPSSRVIADDDRMRETWRNCCSMCVIIKEVMEWQGWQKLSWCGSSVTGFILFACIQWLNKKYYLILNNYFCSLKLLVYSSKLIEQFNMMIQWDLPCEPFVLWIQWIQMQ